jgi:1-acyl-sn-glycerol-3-phosphate acyltransferase
MYQVASFFFKEMNNTFNYTWRWLCTCLAYISFALGGLILYLTIFKVIQLLSRSKTISEQRVRKVICASFNLLLNVLTMCKVLKIEANLENLAQLQSTLIICNHPCLLDVVVIMAKLPNCQCVVKNELWHNPFLGGVVRSAGFICNNLDQMIFLEQCKQELARGQNIIIFPEGTRSTPGQEIKMQRGVGNLALATTADIQALTISCQPLTLTKTDKWYKIPQQKINLKLTIGKKFLNKDYSGIEARSLKVRALMRDIQQYYNGCVKIE